MIESFSVAIGLFYAAVIMVTIAFVVLALYLSMNDRLGKHAQGPRFGRMQRFMTRHQHQPDRPA